MPGNLPYHRPLQNKPTDWLLGHSAPDPGTVVAQTLAALAGDSSFAVGRWCQRLVLWRGQPVSSADQQWGDGAAGGGD